MQFGYKLSVGKCKIYASVCIIAGRGERDFKT
jgi:hypothetical protein